MPVAGRWSGTVTCHRQDIQAWGIFWRWKFRLAECAADPEQVRVRLVYSASFLQSWEVRDAGLCKGPLVQQRYTVSSFRSSAVEGPRPSHFKFVLLLRVSSWYFKVLIQEILCQRIWFLIKCNYNTFRCRCSYMFAYLPHSVPLTWWSPVINVYQQNITEAVYLTSPKLKYSSHKTPSPSHQISCYGWYEEINFPYFMGFRVQIIHEHFLEEMACVSLEGQIRLRRS